jgi:hypothetical protein
MLHASHSVVHIMPRAMQHAPAMRRSAHQHLPRSPSTAVMPAGTAGTGGERAARTCHAAMRRKTPYTCRYLVHNAGVLLRAAHCRRSTRTSRRRSRSLKPLSAAQVMRRSEMVAARSAHSHAPPARARLNALDSVAHCAPTKTARLQVRAMRQLRQARPAKAHKVKGLATMLTQTALR